jgi:hypothetical protein
MTTDKNELSRLIAELAEALLKVDRLLFDEEYPHELGPPCSAVQLDTLQRRLGRPLPPSYRAFLDLHNGWDSVSGDAKILSVEDQSSEWVAKRVEWLGVLFYDIGKDPFANGSLPVFLGTDARNFVLLDPTTERPDGEMDLVAYDLIREEERFPDFTAFLRQQLKVNQHLIERELKGKTE